MLRAPTFSFYGWNPAIAAAIDLPTLVLQGTDDVTAPPINAPNIFNSLHATSHKALVEIECASHFMQSEVCTDASRCTDSDPATVPYGQTAQQWEGPHRTIAAAISEWVRKGTVNEIECGRFGIGRGGVISTSTPC